MAELEVRKHTKLVLTKELFLARSYRSQGTLRGMHPEYAEWFRESEIANRTCPYCDKTVDKRGNL